MKVWKIWFTRFPRALFFDRSSESWERKGAVERVRASNFCPYYFLPRKSFFERIRREIFKNHRAEKEPETSNLSKCCNKPPTVSSPPTISFLTNKTMKRFVEARHFSLSLFDRVNSSRASPQKQKYVGTMFRKRDEEGGKRSPRKSRERRAEGESVSLKFPAYCRAFGVRE